jgi:serine/threonine-protein kinase
VVSLAAAAGALLALVVVAVYMVVTRSGAQEMAITVPDVRGLRAADAVADLRGRGFTDVRLPTRSDARSGSLIVSQQPGPGASILPAQPITLTVAGPRPRVRVPRVTGLPPDEAAARLRQADLDVRADNAWRDDPVIAPNRVIGTVPGPGALIEAGSSIQLVVSLGNGVDDPGSSTAPTVTP